MKNLTKLMIAILALVALETSCSHGFIKEDGLLYKFHMENKDSVQPQIGDLVEFSYSFRTKDSVISENQIEDIIIESIYLGDVYAALRKLHLGDSATFIMNGDTFYHYFMDEPFPSDKSELYFDAKLIKITPKEEFEKQQAEKMKQYESFMEELKNLEESMINDYITNNKVKVKPCESGLYFMKSFSGKGKPILIGSKVSVNLTGKLLNGTIFSSSLDSGVPFEITVGNSQIILGLKEALLLMKEGDKATVLIPSKLAYGKNGNRIIQPYTPLIFDLEIVSVE
ncbi:MAG: FKBP-type peptidyl-prolyl cis-trans isomerase [Bacteroidales bacterium]|jgi:FKBP-type peptidyl-prolyl cis-trans isomerase|nr:FKBP-type peptidyl-prolyl cis-trans isomerase [Bacteroidales bacterium]